MPHVIPRQGTGETTVVSPGELMGRLRLREGNQFPVLHSRAGPVSCLWGRDSATSPTLRRSWKMSGTDNALLPRRCFLQCDVLSLRLCPASHSQRAIVLHFATSGPISLLLSLNGGKPRGRAGIWAQVCRDQLLLIFPPTGRFQNLG